ncbi:hypothetical protein LUZ63_020598 [Rhynchospora breviuscula]|uniref:Uncharacterized protein n=1 Tax=Rhynchospora breviuscula TaxID=2022672 RepID=A0A9Q0BZP1_9POAL|nr:hypothetical protein LUZ63_020598 [Rhynchospora breviuscula]
MKDSLSCLRHVTGGFAYQSPYTVSRGQPSHTRFSLFFRYSCLHSHSCGVHDWITPPLHSPHDAPLPIHAPGPRRPGSCMNAIASAGDLSPATLSAQNHLTSELLRTLSRVAASKPTSWLSVRLHILFHLVIPQVFNPGGFGPPRGLTRASTCPWIDHSASGLDRATASPCSDSLSLRLPHTG